MRTVLLLAAMVAFAAVGCSKKSAKSTGPANDTPPPPKPLANKAKPDGATDKDKVAGEEKPNWLTDSRFNKKTEGQLPVDAPSKPTYGFNLPPLELPATPTPPVATPPMPTPQPAPMPPAAQPALPPMPAVPPVPAGVPAKPPEVVIPVKPLAPVEEPPAAAPCANGVTQADMKDVWTFINSASSPEGKMPGPDLVYRALIEAKSPAAELVKDGAIVLTGSGVREYIWAFEKGTETKGGWVVTNQGVEQVTAEEFRRLARGR